MNKKTNVVTHKEPQFNKASLINSKRYAEHCDLLQVILKDGDLYTFNQVDKLIAMFLAKEVK